MTLWDLLHADLTPLVIVAVAVCLFLISPLLIWLVVGPFLLIGDWCRAARQWLDHLIFRDSLIFRGGGPRQRCVVGRSSYALEPQSCTGRLAARGSQPDRSEASSVKAVAREDVASRVQRHHRLDADPSISVQPMQRGRHRQLVLGQVLPRP